jgi:hypothetical protein
VHQNNTPCGALSAAGKIMGVEDAMSTSAAAAHVYESVRRRSTGPLRHRMPAAALLPLWLALLMRVVVVGGFAFGSGFLGVVAARSLG